MNKNKSIYLDTNFIRFLTACTFSGLAGWGLIFLLGLSVVQDRLTAVQLGVALGVRTVGYLVGVIGGGVLADKFSRRKTILLSGTIAGLGILIILFGFHVDILLVYLGVIISGLGQGISSPANQSFLPTIVCKEKLPPAIAAISLSIRLVILLGPAVASLLIVAFGIDWAYFLLAMMWFVAAFLPPWVEGNKDKKPSQTKKRNVFLQTVSDIGEGLEEAKKHPWFFYGLFALMIVIAVTNSTTNVLLPMISKQQGSMALMAQCITVYAVGGVSGGILMNFYMPKPQGWLSLGGLALYSLVPLSLLFADYPWICITGYLFAGLGMELYNVIWFSSIQSEVDEARLARVSSLDFYCSYGLAPLGLAFIVPLSEVLGLTSTLIFCGLTALIIPVILMTFVPSSKHFSTKKVS